MTKEHRVLHGRVGDGPKVPDSASYQDVQERGGKLKLAVDVRFRIVKPKRCEQHRVLKREVVLSVVEHALKTFGERLRRFT